MAFIKDIIKKFDKTTKFNNDTLDVVVVELKFDELPEAEFKKLNLKYYPHLINDFQFKQEMLFKEILSEVNLVEDSHKSSIRQKPMFLYKDSKEKGSKIINIKPFSFSLEFSMAKEKYEGFNSFKKLFIDKFAAFNNLALDTLGVEIAPMRLGLRKINKIDPKYITQYKMNGFLETNYFQDENYSIFKELSSIEDNCLVVIRSGIITEKDKNFFILDLDIAQDKPNELLNHRESYYDELLNNFNLKIFNIYNYMVGEDFINNELK